MVSDPWSRVREKPQVPAKGRRGPALQSRTVAQGHRVLCGGPAAVCTIEAIRDLKILRFTKRTKQAEPLYKRSLAILEKQLPATDPRIAAVLNNLADFSRQKGKEGAATDYYLRSLDILQKAYGPRDERVKAVLQALAAMSYQPPRIKITPDSALPVQTVRPHVAAASVQ